MNKLYLQFMSSSEKKKMDELVEPITGTATRGGGFDYD
jgi:hypothetical protein